MAFDFRSVWALIGFFSTTSAVPLVPPGAFFKENPPFVLRSFGCDVDERYVSSASTFV